jgi:transcriptional regulator with XRE-family HTH domain
MMAPNTPSLSSVVGRELRVLREAGRITQAQLAAAAKQLGMEWTKATVATIELGRRQLSIGEFLLLPEILGRAGAGWGYDLSDLLPDISQPVLVAGAVTAPANVIRARFADQDENPEERGARLAAGDMKLPALDVTTFKLPRRWLLDMLQVKRLEDVPERFWIEVGLEAAGDAELKAAASIGVPALALALAARRRWGASLTRWRDRLVEMRTAKARELDHVEDWPRRLQAVRGHTTRELLDELRPLLEGATTKKKTARERGAKR